MKDADDKKKEARDKLRENGSPLRKAALNGDYRRKTVDSAHVRDTRMSPDERLRRLERIERNDPARKLKDYDVRKARVLEDAEIRTNATAFERRSRDHGMDRATERLVQIEKARQQSKGRRDH